MHSFKREFSSSYFNFNFINHTHFHLSIQVHNSPYSYPLNSTWNCLNHQHSIQPLILKTSSSKIPLRGIFWKPQFLLKFIISKLLNHTSKPLKSRDLPHKPRTFSPLNEVVGFNCLCRNSWRQNSWFWNPSLQNHQFTHLWPQPNLFQLKLT